MPTAEPGLPVPPLPLTYLGIALAPDWTDLIALAAGFVASLIAIITSEMKPHVSDRRDEDCGPVITPNAPHLPEVPGNLNHRPPLSGLFNLENTMKKEVKKNVIMDAIVDQSVLKVAAEKYLKASAIYEGLSHVRRFNWSSLWLFWESIYHLLVCIVSSIELAKAELQKTLPEGTIIDGTIALEAAIDIFDECVTFTGIIGKVIEKVDGPILKLLV